MVGAKGKLRFAEGGILNFWCFGCEEFHGIKKRDALGGWTFNGNYDAPTFTPSVLTTSGHYTSGFVPGSDCWCTYNAKHTEDPAPFHCERCHLFVVDGKIQYLSDSTHKLAGKTVDMRTEVDPC